MVWKNCKVKLSVNKAKLTAVVILPWSKKGKGCMGWKDQSWWKGFYSLYSKKLVTLQWRYFPVFQSWCLLQFYIEYDKAGQIYTNTYVSNARPPLKTADVFVSLKTRFHMHCQIKKLTSKTFGFNSQNNEKKKVLTLDPRQDHFKSPLVWAEDWCLQPKPEEQFRLCPNSLDDKTYFSGISVGFCEGHGTHCSAGGVIEYQHNIFFPQPSPCLVVFYFLPCISFFLLGINGLNFSIVRIVGWQITRSMVQRNKLPCLLQALLGT